MGWLEPIRYHRDERGWWASARNLSVSAPTKESARAKLYRVVNKHYAERAEVGVASVLAALEGETDE